MRSQKADKKKQKKTRQKRGKPAPGRERPARLLQRPPGEESMLALQRMVGNRAAQRLLMEPSPEADVQRQEAQQSFDVRYDVPLMPQLTNMSCWAAGTSMLVAWRDSVSINPSDIAAGTGYWRQYANNGPGLDAEDTTMFSYWGLTPEPPQSYTPQGMADLLSDYGPLWLASAVPSPHIRVVTGISGDGTIDGTTVHINDPWPVGSGSQYGVTFRALSNAMSTLGSQELATEAAPFYVAHN